MSSSCFSIHSIFRLIIKKNSRNARRYNFWDLSHVWAIEPWFQHVVEVKSSHYPSWERYENVSQISCFIETLSWCIETVKQHYCRWIVYINCISPSNWSSPHGTSKIKTFALGGLELISRISLKRPFTKMVFDGMKDRQWVGLVYSM